MFIAEKNIPTHQGSWTNTSDNIDYVISSRAIYNNIQDISLNNNLSSDHSAILSNFSANINKSISPPNKVNLYHKANWDSVNPSLSNQLATIREVTWFLIENYVWKLWSQIVSTNLSLCLSSEIKCRDQKRHTNTGQLYKCKEIKNLRAWSDKNVVLNAWEKVADQLDPKFRLVFF